MKTMPLSEARRTLPKLVSESSRRMNRTIITRNGKAEAVLMGMEEYESWVETLEIISRPETLKALREGIADLKAGRVSSFEEVVKEPLRGKAKRR